MGAQSALSAALDEFLAAVARDFTVEDVLRELAQVATRVLDVDGAGVMVSSDGDRLLRFAHASGTSAAPVAALERLQELDKDGPCHASRRAGAVVTVADLAVDGPWTQYRLAAVAAGIRSVTALPLTARGRVWGALDLYRSEPRPLTDSELGAARTLANLATSYLVVTADRDTARDAQEQLAHRAMHDPLTGLPVRWVFLEQLSHALARLGRRPGTVGVLFLDVDGLKQVNDTLGHQAGDRLLLTCADRARAALRPSDIIARLGGDEFVVLLEDLTGADTAATVARRVLTRLSARQAGDEFRPSVSVGVAVTSDPAENPTALVTHADAAMYRAKRLGRGRYEVFDAASFAAERAAAAARDQLVVELAVALREGQLVLHYQPIIDLTAAHAEPVYAVEALARWRHPQRGLLTAGEFIEAAERSGLLVPVGRELLALACRQLAAWDASLGTRAPRRMFVNVSVEELLHPGLPDHVSATLRESGVAPARLTLEITETGLATDPQVVTAAAQALRRVGCELAIDDVGTGYSSLSRLVQINAGTLKVDASFTQALADDPAAAAVVNAVLQIGSALDRRVVVEGVEDARTLDALRELGCTLAQGNHLGRPQLPDALNAGLAPAARTGSS